MLKSNPKIELEMNKKLSVYVSVLLFKWAYVEVIFPVMRATKLLFIRKGRQFAVKRLVIWSMIDDFLRLRIKKAVLALIWPQRLRSKG